MAVETTVQERNKALMRHYVEEIFNKADWDALPSLVAPDFINHAPSPVGRAPQGIEGFRMAVQALHAAMPDVQNHVEDQIAEGDLVVTRWTARGTHTGNFMGIPPSGRQVTTTGIAIDRFRDGMWVEGWAEYDSFGLMMQFGAVPAPGGAAPPPAAGA